MARILIIGAGVMGTSLAVPAADNGHEVTVAGSPLDDAIIDRLRGGGAHPKLDHALPETVRPIRDADLTAAAADLVIMGVSSPGIGWAVERLRGLLTRPTPVAFVTKGLDRAPGVVSYAQSLPAQIPQMAPFIGIGGPCIARELARRVPTLSVYASADLMAARFAADRLRTPYYRLAVTEDAPGVEACAALKNFYAIGVSAMMTRYPDTARHGAFKNPTAGAFNQAVREMADLVTLIGGRRETAFDLAGLGDLHVTVGGGRNSRLGHGLGEGLGAAALMAGPLNGETVEGIDTARLVADLLPPQGFPLARAILRAVLDGEVFDFDVAQLHGAMP